MSDYPTVELYVNSTWTDITSYVRYDDKIQITRGQSGESGSFDTSSCQLTLDNRDGRFSPRNPAGAYYGQIGRNTPLRVSVDGGLPYLNLTGAASGRASTPDNAALDITGDIDVRVEMFLLDWNVTSQTEIIGKYLSTGNQRSWRFYLNTGGYPAITWTADGSTLKTATSTTSLALNGRSRMAIRFTLDVNDGAGNNVVTFYTADDISGTWTQLGTAVTTVGVTSIFSGSATLDIGDINNSSLTPMTGRVYKAQVLSGIAGSAVANPDFTAQSVGATSFADAAGRTWTITAPATIANRKIRFTGEVSSWDVAWDTAGVDVVTKIEASGIVRRLTQGDSPLRSAVFREFTNPARTSIVAYWPMEDQEGSTLMASGFADYPSMTYSGTPTLATSSVWAGSAPLPQIGTAIFSGTIPSYTVTTEHSFRFLCYMPATGPTSEGVLFSIRSASGSIARWEVSVNTSGQLKTQAYGTTGTELTGTGYVAFDIRGKLSNIVLEITQSGANVDWELLVQNYSSATDISDPIGTTSTSGSVASVTQGGFNRVVIGGGTLGETVIGHVTLADSLSAYASTDNAILGWRGETPANRIYRLVSTEENIPFQFHSRAQAGNFVTLGVQEQKNLVDLIRESGDTDLGLVFEPRDEAAIGYRTRLSLYNQDPALTLDYAQHQLSAPPIPVDDDRNTRNDITVTRQFGSAYRATLETGTLSVQAPPDGVGRYDDSVTLSLGSDEQLPDQAAWRLHLGTVDEARHPSVSVNLRHSTFTSSAAMAEDALELDIGDRALITNPPSWLPPDNISQLVIGFTESIGGSDQHDIVFVCTPESPWEVAVADTDRADTSGSELASGISSSDTSLSVSVTAGNLWTTDVSQFPFDIAVGGEVMTVSAISGGSSPQTFTVTRGTNGITKSHLAGSDVRLASPAIAAL